MKLSQGNSRKFGARQGRFGNGESIKRRETQACARIRPLRFRGVNRDVTTIDGRVGEGAFPDWCEHICNGAGALFVGEQGRQSTSAVSFDAWAPPVCTVGSLVQSSGLRA